MIHLVGIGGIAVGTLDALAARLARELRTGCRVSAASLDPGFAFDPVRRQYHSTQILRRLSEGAANGDRVLGVTPVDLFVPIFTYVFGEAQLSGPAALVSTYRLQQELYGEPPQAGLTNERLVKEALHELGHTYGLRHCQDWSCPMASSTAIDRLDLKATSYCPSCRNAIGLAH